jgi:hypothetical protein
VENKEKNRDAMICNVKRVGCWRPSSVSVAVVEEFERRVM